ncbi:nucleotidyl transferase AbiEii/AbiGii toxin family protein [Bradyrhizobium sp. SRL28]|uniref:nucleotidyl transferase AbiEii/AbiGii toxin family protein n=1 Tax=Bradyrhizobium sp. SRL28 TaxID=2836178 RepID=UPI0027DF57FF|nr:nucleotidyl transferase AbiEii/AbiGii toxin family protein [Bradyrhizobium sp. SRL28]
MVYRHRRHIDVSNEELLSTKLRALLQCHKGRDLIDIAHALDIFEGFDASTTVEVLGKYLAAGGISISRAEAEKRMFTKLNNPNFMVAREEFGSD